MALVTDNTVLLHIPKTGGVFIKNALVACGIRHELVGNQHDHFPRLLDAKPISFFADKLVYTFVRHPITWYQSRWSFRVKYGWQAIHPLDFNCASNNFHVFVDKVLQFKPDGWCAHLFDDYIKNGCRNLDFIGKTENLVNDFLHVMRRAGEQIDEDRVRNLPLINDSRLDGRASGYWAKYTQSLFDRVLAVESNVIQEYYYNYKLDPYKYIGELK
jgi:hypothetical protein